MKSVLVVICFCFFILSPVTSSAYERGGNSSSKQQNNLVVGSSDEAAQLVKSSIGGKILKIKRTKVNGHAGYKVKVIKADGNIVSILVDATSGRISRN